MATIPTLSQKLAFIRNQVKSANQNVSTVPGSGGSDLFTTPLSVIDIGLEAQGFYISTSQSITDLLALKADLNTLTLLSRAYNVEVSGVLANISQTLDSLGKNLSETRKQPQMAQGSVSFGRPDTPDQDYVVPAGTVVKSNNGSQYATTADVTMYQANAAQYFDSTLFLYLLQVPVKAVLAGSAANVPTSSIISIVTPVTGFPFVTNTSEISQGTDLETDEDFGARLILKWQAVGRTTPGGIQSAVLDNSSVTSLYLAKPGDVLSARGFGKVDLFIKEKSVSSFTETFSGYNSSLYSGCILPSKRPLVSLTSVDSGTPYLQKDPSSVVAGSSQSQDVIRFSIPPTFPVTITYEYDSMPATVQSIFDIDENAPINQQPVIDLPSAMNTAILVKACPELDIDYAATIQVLPGYTKSDVIAAVQNNIITYGESLVLGQAVYVDDIDKIVDSTPGVLRIQGEPTKFSPSNQSGVSQGPIVPANNQLIVFLNVNIF